MRVEIVHWPEEAEHLTRLRLAHRPRLVIVDVDVEPPDPPDALEDWVRTTTPIGDIEIRTAQIARRAAVAATGGSGARDLSDLGVFTWRRRTVVLSPIETRLTRALLFADGTVVPRQALEAAGWPGTSVRRSTFDTSIARLRRRLATVGLDLRTIRNRGYMLDVETPPDEIARPARGAVEGAPADLDARQPSDVGTNLVTGV